MMLIIYIWGILSLVIIGYVAYRILTDRKSGEKQHSLYPIISNKTDGIFPARGKYLSWAWYLFLLSSLVVFIIIMFYEITK